MSSARAIAMLFAPLAVVILGAGSIGLGSEMVAHPGTIVSVEYVGHAAPAPRTGP